MVLVATPQRPARSVSTRGLDRPGDCKKPFLVFQLDHSEFPDEVLYFVTGFPRLSVTALDRQGLRTELSRLLVD